MPKKEITVSIFGFGGTYEKKIRLDELSESILFRAKWRSYTGVAKEDK